MFCGKSPGVQHERMIARNERRIGQVSCPPQERNLHTTTTTLSTVSTTPQNFPDGGASKNREGEREIREEDIFTSCCKAFTHGMQSPWRPPNLHHHPTSSCPSSPPPTGIAAAQTHKATIVFNPSSKGVSCRPRFANGRELLLGFAPGISKRRRSEIGSGGWWMVWCYSSSGEVGCVEEEEVGCDEYLVRNSGWGVRRMVEEWDEMRSVAFIQAEAFHVPLALFDDLFFKFFQAEVLSALLYRIRNSLPNRYACLVAEPVDGSNPKMSSGIVGVIDITVQRDADVLTYLDGEEYIYVSGIAVLKQCRRMKVGSSLLKACEAMSKTWGFRYLVLRAYEDDWAALRLYKKLGYEIVSGDPKWMTTWIGRRRRVLMIKSA